jgi:hypothetical protein
MNHEMGLKLTLEISKQEILRHYHANFKLSIHWKQVKVGTQPDSAQEDRKLGVQEIFCK